MSEPAASNSPAPPARAKPSRLELFAGFLALAGIISGCVGGYRWYCSGSDSVDPQQITVRELLQNGPKENRHLFLTGGHEEGFRRFALDHEFYDAVFPDDAAAGEAAHPKYQVVLVVEDNSWSRILGHPLGKDRKRGIQGVVRMPSSREESEFKRLAGFTNALILVEGARPAVPFSTTELLIYLALLIGGIVVGGLLAFCADRWSSAQPRNASPASGPIGEPAVAPDRGGVT